MTARVRGSVRFDPYFKAQWWDPRAMAWRDVRRPHASEAAAVAAFDPQVADRWRVMRVHPGGRAPVAGSERSVRP